MGRIYEKLKAGDDAVEAMLDAMRRYHGRLEEAGVTVDVLWTEDTDGKPMLVGGYPAIAKIRICSLDERVAGRADAEIVLDRGKWTGLMETEQLAVMDHELTHLTLVVEDQGKPKLDDHGRPRLKPRKHDLQVGWFQEVAERHQSMSQEYQQARHVVGLYERWQQMELAFVADGLPETVEPPKRATGKSRRAAHAN